jgi:uncharacterized protein (DUF3820 family)
MERLGTFTRNGLGDIATQTWWYRCGRGGKFQGREVIDRTGPGKLKIFKRRIFPRGGGKVWPWRHQKNNVPESGSDYGSARDTTLDPAIS